VACTIGRGAQTGDLDLIGKTLGVFLSAKWVETSSSRALTYGRQEGKCGFGGASRCAVLFNVSGFTAGEPQKNWAPWAMAFGCLGMFLRPGVFFLAYGPALVFVFRY